MKFCNPKSSMFCPFFVSFPSRNLGSGVWGWFSQALAILVLVICGFVLEVQVQGLCPQHYLSWRMPWRDCRELWRRGPKKRSCHAHVTWLGLGFGWWVWMAVPKTVFIQRCCWHHNTLKYNWQRFNASRHDTICIYVRALLTLCFETHKRPIRR